MTENIALRERKKIKIRQAVVAKAWELFTAKGFENVKVADIADGADISVKTLFTYFNSKEDIVFSGEDELLNEIIRSIKTRKPGDTLLNSITDLIMTLLRNKIDPLTVETDELIKLIASNIVIQKRLLIMWRKYEERLRGVLDVELHMESDDPRAEVIACNLVLPFRMIFEFKIKDEKRPLSDSRWFEKLMDTIKNGIGDF
jgi:AcrR family transcriptional regulator